MHSSSFSNVLDVKCICVRVSVSYQFDKVRQWNSKIDLNFRKIYQNKNKIKIQAESGERKKKEIEYEKSNALLTHSLTQTAKLQLQKKQTNKKSTTIFTINFPSLLFARNALNLNTTIIRRCHRIGKLLHSIACRWIITVCIHNNDAAEKFRIKFANAMDGQLGRLLNRFAITKCFNGNKRWQKSHHHITITGCSRCTDSIHSIRTRAWNIFILKENVGSKNANVQRAFFFTWNRRVPNAAVKIYERKENFPLKCRWLFNVEFSKPDELPRNFVDCAVCWCSGSNISMRIDGNHSDRIMIWAAEILARQSHIIDTVCIDWLVWPTEPFWIRLNILIHSFKERKTAKSTTFFLINWKKNILELPSKSWVGIDFLSIVSKDRWSVRWRVIHFWSPSVWQTLWPCRPPTAYAVYFQEHDVPHQLHSLCSALNQLHQCSLFYWKVWNKRMKFTWRLVIKWN